MARTLNKTKLEHYEEIARDLKALAHPTRIQILEEMIDGQRLSPIELRRLIEPKVSLGTIAHHVRELYSAGILRKSGTKLVRGAAQHFYVLAPRGGTLYDKHIL